ncbi:MAG: lipid-A-disaccharide synthase [Prevotellaceae bacterium]|jgi:lipid-A-disaccharide synthase|nr:lipid-A-disaccharide synthase [Prevotellaceae bacterium]
MRYFIIVGEASGDLHASALMKELKICDAQAEFCFLGGDLMLNQGGKMVRHYSQMAFMGIVNVLLNLNKVAENARICKRAIRDFVPDVVLLVDYPGFNLRIAKFVKKNLQIPVYYYIAPKLWAWKSYRIKSIKKYVDRAFTIFPFETQYFAQFGYNVDYVGNPTVDSIDNFLESGELKSIKSDKSIVALLSGSRRQEISKCLPVMSKMAGYFTDFKFVVAAAPSIEKDFYTKILPDNVEIVYNQTYSLVKQSFAAVVNSGTATLETALLGTPQVVVYHVIGGRFATLLKKILIHIPYISLVNLIAEKEAVKELVTHHFTEENLRNELCKVLYDNNLRDKIEQDYQKIKLSLGHRGTAKQAAEAIYKNAKQVISE